MGFIQIIEMQGPHKNRAQILFNGRIFKDKVITLFGDDLMALLEALAQNKIKIPLTDELAERLDQMLLSEGHKPE